MHGSLVSIISNVCFSALCIVQSPLWLEFENSESKIAQFIFKTGDDLRTDILSLQMIRIMDHVRTPLYLSTCTLTKEALLITFTTPGIIVVEARWRS